MLLELRNGILHQDPHASSILGQKVDLRRSIEGGEPIDEIALARRRPVLARRPGEPPRLSAGEGDGEEMLFVNRVGIAMKVNLAGRLVYTH
jgi:hypothetical protein